jgi:hypothetical protein
MKRLKEIAESSLRKNILCLSSGKFLTAGQHQFKTLWTRDFCHAVRGLLVIGEEEVAHNHLALLLKSLRSDGLVPRVFDNHPVQARVVWQSLRTLVKILPELSLREPLNPQYTDEHGSHAFDSNVLVVLSCLMMGEKFFIEFESDIRLVWEWYEDKFDDGLLKQAPFSDWQDTTKREGKTFLLNLYYYLAARRLEKRGWKISTDLDLMKEKMMELFFNGKLFRSQEGHEIVSVEGNLFALETEEFLSAVEKRDLWSHLKQHELITLDGVIGRASFPDWPREDLAFHVRLANLDLYHGSITWSWIAGLGLKVAKVMRDQEMIEKELLHFEKLFSNGEISEIYDPRKNFSPWESWLLKSEHPFAWGAAYVLESLHFSV